MKPLLFLASLILSIYFISQGYNGLSNPQAYKSTFNKVTNFLFQSESLFGINVQKNSLLLIKLFGLFQIITALLIIGEDCWGSFLAIFILMNSIFQAYLKNGLQLNSIFLYQSLNFIGLIGVAIHAIRIYSNYQKVKSDKK